MIAEGLASGRASFFGTQSLVSRSTAVHATHQPEPRPHLTHVSKACTMFCRAYARPQYGTVDPNAATFLKGFARGTALLVEGRPICQDQAARRCFFPAGGKTTMQDTGRRASQDHGCPDREAIHSAQGRHPGEHRAEEG